jgi:SPP1 family predicted phage head-tail adaptor
MPKHRPRISDLDHRLVLEYARRTPDGAGGFTTTWASLADVWADIRPRGGTETLDAGGIKGHLTHDIIVRPRAEITPSRRFRCNTRLFHIHAVHALDNKGRRTVCLCEEVNL